MGAPQRVGEKLNNLNPLHIDYDGKSGVKNEERFFISFIDAFCAFRF
jgi:hypothetical protein